MLPGGGDVAPTYYGQSPVPQLTSTDRLRDNVELTLCRAAAQHKKPLLGICRGAQVLNVAFGGTLWQDIPAQCRAAICHYQDSAARGELFHSLTLAPDSLLARIMGPGQHECNTFHHQALRRRHTRRTALWRRWKARTALRWAYSGTRRILRPSIRTMRPSSPGWWMRRPGARS